MFKQGLSVLAIIFSTIVFYGMYQNFKTIQPIVLDMKEKQNDFNVSYEKYTNHLEEVLNKQSGFQIQNKSGSISNFEGPRIEIDSLIHHKKRWEKEKEPEFTFTKTELRFDPDHQDYGLPDLYVKLEQPKFISTLRTDTPSGFKDEIQKYIPSISDIRPVKSYTKTYKTDNGTYKEEKFDLYITEFSITLGIKPLRAEPNFDLSNFEKKEKIFPREWYQHDLYKASSRYISINDFKDAREYKSQRYSQISVIFKIYPNDTVWYIKNAKGQQNKASVAIGSIVSKKIINNVKVQTYKEAQIIPGSPGVNVYMYSDRDLNGLYPSSEVVTEDPRNRTDSKNETIFNGKPIYFRIVSNNIGSWDGKYFWKEDWDDQFTIKFFMPLLVKGKLEVILDEKLIPKYKAPETYYNKFSFADILPDWGFELGKYITYVMIGFIIIIVLFFIPNLFALPNAILGWIADKIKSKKQ